MTDDLIAPEELSREEEMDPLEALELALKYSRDVGLYCGQGTTETRPSVRKQLFGMMRRAESALESLKPRLLELLGGGRGDVPLAHATYNALRGRRVCQKCGNGGGWRGRNLHFWTPEGEPLPYVLMKRGAGVEALREAAAHCALLCPRCARARGCKFTRRGYHPMTQGVEL